MVPAFFMMRNQTIELKTKLQAEKNYVQRRGAQKKFALIYPNAYGVGMSNLGLHVVYDLINRRREFACERFFLPDPKLLNQLTRSREPLLSLETQTPLLKFPIIGACLTFEPDYFNLLAILSLGRIKLRAEQRGERDPLIIAGGPCATFNPMPLSTIIDAFVIGEGEVIMPAVLDVLSQSLSRSEMLQALSTIEGVYVPTVEQSSVKRRWLIDLDAQPAHTVVVADNLELDMYLIEVARGCGRHCRFCMAGYCFRRPRVHSLDTISNQLDAAAPFGKKIGLMGAAVSDYPHIDELCRMIIDRGMTLSVASFRADSVTKTLVDSLVASGTRTLTIAPEAGSERMRAVINKGITVEHVFNTIELGLAAGIRHFRLYFMIGLPFETIEDVDEIVALSNRIKDFVGEGVRLTLSVNAFVPKPFTPFQWEPMADRKYIERAFKTIREGLKRRGVEVITDSSRAATVQSILARGGRELGEVLLSAHDRGGAKSFMRALKDHGLDGDEYLYRPRGTDEQLPWDVLDQGFDKKYLIGELDRARQLKSTAPCVDGCKRCGVCK